MKSEEENSIRKGDNELGVPMRIMAALLAFFGWKSVYLTITNPAEYLEKGINIHTVSSMVLLIIALILLSMGAIVGRVPKKFTDAVRNYENQRKK